MRDVITMDKCARLLDLAKQRHTTRWNGYTCIGDYHHGAYEYDAVSPYSKTAGNIDARVFVLLQDWASDDALRQPLNADIVRFGHLPGLPTNKNLKRLLEAIFSVQLTDVYGTNLFPFIKPRRDERADTDEVSHTSCA